MSTQNRSENKPEPSRALSKEEIEILKYYNDLNDDGKYCLLVLARCGINVPQYRKNVSRFPTKSGQRN
ncbi:MAG: hypothetical protein NC084_10215 [Bacteroides sp.]|nr:hypothetical protein [Eubacterium sp.]MCM1419176.1 hypothetical protein [Roseburia sp.]MCM1463073.1 hypothetical protein [Bacteroides sp.]